MQNQLSSKIANAAKWSAFAEIAAKLIAPVTNIVLARLLAPEAFGVVATLMLVVSFAEIFTDAGFQKYLVQHEFADEQELERSTNVAFWSNLVFSLLLWLMIALFAAPITRLVGSPGCESAVIVMSAQIPLMAFSSIQTARYRREFDFKNLFYVRIASSLVPLVVTVPLALIFHSYWALVWGTLGKELLNAAILTARSSWKPRVYYSFHRLKEMLSFSIWTIIENISTWLTLNVDVFLVGMVLNSYTLGLYKTSISTVNSLMNLITGASMPVLFSALSRCQNRKEEFLNVFYRFQKIIALIVLPMGFGIFVYRDLATSLLLGSQWMETADFLGMWALTSALTIVFHNPNSEAFRSQGRPKLSVLTQILHLIALIPAVALSMGKGYKILVFTRSAVRLEMILVSSVIAYVSCGMCFSRAVKGVFASLISALVMAAAGTLLCSLTNNIFCQIGTIFLCMLIYFSCMWILPSGRKQLLELLTYLKTSVFIHSKEKKNVESKS